MKVVTMTAYNRPEFLSQVVTSIMEARNASDYRYVISVDASDKFDANIKALDKLYLCKEIIVNEPKLGCSSNTGHALRRGFNRGADFVIHIEDDCIISPDFFLYMEWANKTFAQSAHVDYVSGWQRTVAGALNDVVFRNHFTPWGFGTWRRVFEQVWPEWDHGYVHNGWDWNLRRLLNHNLEVYPAISRVQNIGTYGVHVPSPEFHAAEQQALVVSENREDLEWNIVSS